MAKKSKQILQVNGIDYEPIPKDKARRFRAINDHSNTISRNQAEKGKIKQQGFKSYSQKAKARKAAGIPKGFKQKKLNPHSDRAYYRRSLETITELKETLEKIPDETRGFIIVHMTKNYPHLARNKGESTKAFNARKNLHFQRAITQSGTPSYLLTHYKYPLIKKKLENEGWHVEKWEIVFTFIPAQ